ncbi:hypothetical protein [Opitutus terrae]|uniref:Uncharacterized protein n=1 Tax=Opitutus terrae (strain DSM 11246 / JCM 15787 / PB90-1) TaxID=452637 RepID=B1ZRD2_OPITP|nr:hypothetical protein [Opitutus terrae]ACB74619.1 hypothetical protein Oter_1334 [Opitutus terrae PB90-1]
MHDWIVLAAVLFGTLVLSLVFWRRTMPRLSASDTSRRTRLWNALGFGVVLLALPVTGLLLLEEKSVTLVGAIIVGWAMAVRATGWFAARKWLVPRLKAMQASTARENPPAPAAGAAPRSDLPAGGSP